MGFGASIVALNAYLPGLARSAPEVVALEPSSLPSRTEEEHQKVTDSQDAYQQAVARSTARISAQGIAIGYASGISLLLLCMVPVTVLGGSTWSLRIAIMMSGIWWCLGSFPCAAWLKSEGDTGTESRRRADGEHGVGREILEAWKRLGQMIRPREMKRLKHTFWFLAAWFLLSDGESDSVQCDI